MSKASCVAKDCDQAAKVQGLCKRHYEHGRRHGGDYNAPVQTPRTKGECGADGCSEPERTRGFCSMHYQRARRNGGDPNVATRTRNDTPQPCAQDGCDEVARARGYCQPHYMRLWRHGDAGAEVRAHRDPVCLVEGCDRAHFANGYCSGHNARWRAKGDPGPAELGTKTPRGERCVGPECAATKVVAKELCAAHYEQDRQGRPLTPIRKYESKEGPCKVDSCDRPRSSEGLCQTHHRRQCAGEENWDRPVRKYAPAGAGHVDKHGYRIIHHEGRARREHHVIAERLLGRRLLPKEEVHHLNGNRSDNRTNGPFVLDGNGRLISGNLDLWSKAQPAGQEIGPKLDWAAEMIELYGQAWLPVIADHHPRRDALLRWAAALLDQQGQAA